MMHTIRVYDNDLAEIERATVGDEAVEWQLARFRRAYNIPHGMFVNAETGVAIHVRWYDPLTKRQV